jgi:hypothetical protein
MPRAYDYFQQAHPRTGAKVDLFPPPPETGLNYLELAHKPQPAPVTPPQKWALEGLPPPPPPPTVPPITPPASTAFNWGQYGYGVGVPGSPGMTPAPVPAPITPSTSALAWTNALLGKPAVGPRNWINPNGTINTAGALPLQTVIQNQRQQVLPRSNLPVIPTAQASGMRIPSPAPHVEKGLVPFKTVEWTKNLSPDFYHSQRFQRWYTSYWINYQLGKGPETQIPDWIQRELGYDPQKLEKDSSILGLSAPVGATPLEDVKQAAKYVLNMLFDGSGTNPYLLPLLIP